MTIMITHSDVFVRTEAGRNEIRAKALPLSRPARNLLLVLDGSCSGAQWVAKVQGSSGADLQQLIDAQLIAPVAASGASSGSGAAAGAAEGAGAPGVSLDEALQKWSYDALYTLLTHEARERFGLIKGYRLILEIEGVSNLAGLQGVAHKFVEELRKAHGESTAARFRKQLGASA
jgi:hypothetical protein